MFDKITLCTHENEYISQIFRYISGDIETLNMSVYIPRYKNIVQSITMNGDFKLIGHNTEIKHETMKDMNLPIGYLVFCEVYVKFYTTMKLYPAHICEEHIRNMCWSLLSPSYSNNNPLPKKYTIDWKNIAINFMMKHKAITKNYPHVLTEIKTLCREYPPCFTQKLLIDDNNEQLFKEFKSYAWWSHDYYGFNEVVSHELYDSETNWVATTSLVLSDDNIETRKEINDNSIEYNILVEEWKKIHDDIIDNMLNTIIGDLYKKESDKQIMFLTMSDLEDYKINVIYGDIGIKKINKNTWNGYDISSGSIQSLPE